MRLIIYLAIIFHATLLSSRATEEIDSTLSIDGLRCENKEAPVGIDTPLPRFSWVLQSTRSGVSQGAYRLLIATSPEKLSRDQGDVWDSGKIVSDDQIGITIPKRLNQQARYYWKVKMWDQLGNESPWSPSSICETGFFDLESWPAAWFKAVKFSVNYARREFSLPASKAIESARLYVAATGAGCNSYEVRLNGTRVGDDLYAPGPCEPFKALYSTFDIQSLIKPGVNALALLYNASASVYMIIKYADGSSLIVCSDDTWKGTAKGPYQNIGTNKPWGGGQRELYDARQEQPGWDKAGFDDHSWEALSPVPADFGFHADSKARWIWSAAKPADPVVFFRYMLSAPKAQSGSIRITGDDSYEVYFNGLLLGSGTDWTKQSVYSVELQEGKNLIAVKARNATGSAGIIAELSAGAQRWTTGDDWKVNTTEFEDWNQIAYQDNDWAKAKTIAPIGNGPWEGLFRSITKLKARLVPCKIIAEIKPVSIMPHENGRYIVDFGQQVTGHIRLAAKGGKPGGTLSVSYAEMLAEDGKNLDQRSIQRNPQHAYIFADDKAVLYDPRFFNVGFRYVEINGYPGQLTADSITSLAVASDVINGSTFSCSSPVLNRLHHMAVWSFLGNLQNIPTDCPGRERRGWTGDCQVVCAAECLNFDMRNMIDKWLDDYVDCQEPSGWIPVELPMMSDGNKDIRWSASAIFIPWDIYQAYGDKSILAKYYPLMSGYLKFLQSIAKPDCSFPDGGMWKPYLSYGDWLAPDPASSAYLGTLFYYRCADLMSKIADELNKKDDAEKYAALASTIKAAIQTTFRKEGSGIYYDNNSQTANAHALGFGIVADADRSAVLKSLIDDYHAKGHNTTAFLGIRWVLPVLSAGERNDIAYSYITNSGDNGWISWINKFDATTMLEEWDYRKTSSHNHGFLAGSLSEWFYQDLAGISALKPGFKQIRIKPYIPEDVQWAKASIHTVRGWVKSEWKKTGKGSITLLVTIPVNSTATIYIPAGYSAQINKSKSCDTGPKENGVKHLRDDKGCIVYAVGSGNYEFTASKQEN